MGFSRQETGVGSHSLLPTQGSNPSLLHRGQILYHISHQESQLKKKKTWKNSQLWVIWQNIQENLASVEGMISPQFSSVAQSCPTLCDPVNHSMPGLPDHHQLPEFTQTHVHQVGDTIQPSLLCRPLLLLPPIPPSIRVFSNESTLHEVAKVLEFQLQHQRMISPSHLTNHKGKI